MTLLFIIIIILIIIILLSSSSNHESLNQKKGKEGESEVNKILVSVFKRTKYYLFKDILIPLKNDSTQIDHIVISKYGIFVIETKDYNGWIFGDERSKQWTHVFFKNKYRFQNPLRQNYKHVKVIQEILGIERDKLFSLVVFTDKCNFKTEMPKNVIKVSNLQMALSEYRHERIDSDRIDQFAERIREIYMPNHSYNERIHISNVKSRVDSMNKSSNSF